MTTQKETFIKMSDGNSYCIMTIKEAQSEIQSIADNLEFTEDPDKPDEWTFSAVEMAKDEFDKLDEFQGF